MDASLSAKTEWLAMNNHPCLQVVLSKIISVSVPLKTAEVFLNSEKWYPGQEHRKVKEAGDRWCSVTVQSYLSLFNIQSRLQKPLVVAIFGTQWQQFIKTLVNLVRSCVFVDSWAAWYPLNVELHHVWSHRHDAWFFFHSVMLKFHLVHLQYQLRALLISNSQCTL